LSAPSDTGSSARLSRRQALGILAAAGAYAISSSAQANRLSYDLKATEVASRTWMVEGRSEYFSLENGGNIVNIAFIEVPDGVVVIDTGPSKRYGEALLALIQRTIPGKPILRVYNTHHHPDHFLGNQAFSAQAIAAPQTVIDNISAEGEAFTDNMYRLIGDWMRGTAPLLPQTVLSKDTEDVGGRRFSHFFLAGHSSSDLVIRDDETGVLFAGDLAFLDRAATTPHADIAQWQQTLALLAGTDREMILPGHGLPDRSGASIEQTADYLDWLDGVLREAASEGLTMNEAMRIEIPARFNSLAVVDTEFQRSVVHLYLQLEDELMPLIEMK
jgi:uncharacterized sulfatase